MPVLGGREQGGPAVAGGLIDWGSGRDQNARRFEAAFARREYQGGETSALVVLSTVEGRIRRGGIGGHQRLGGSGAGGVSGSLDLRRLRSASTVPGIGAIGRNAVRDGSLLRRGS